METVRVFTSPKEPIDVSRETVRRGFEFLARHGMTAEELRRLRRHWVEPLARAIDSDKGYSPR